LLLLSFVEDITTS